MELPFAVQSGSAGEAVAIDWEAVESWLGLRLPADYKDLATSHGPLDIGEFIWLHVPCVQEGRFDYGDWLKETHRLCRSWSRSVPPYTPPAFHPEPGGLLAWGTTRRAGYLFWDTSASPDPDQWPVVTYESDAANAGQNPWQHLGLPLLEMLDATIRTSALPRTARRTAFLPDAGAWTPPPPPEPVDPSRQAALTEGEGLDALRQLVPPPATPYLGDDSWERLFDRLGTRLPTEYVTLLETYGSGSWRSWLNFVTPLRDPGATQSKGYRGLADFVEQMLDNYRELRAEFPEYQPLAVWPEPGGFLPFADSIDGDVFGWLTLGEPDDWPVIISPRHDDQGPPLPDGLVDTLLAWLRGRPVSSVFEQLDEADDPLEYATFEPWNAESYL
jgi:hypothetical protein